MIGGEPRSQPLGLHTSGQTPKVKGLQSAYMEALFGTFGAKSLASRDSSLGASKTETQTLVERSNFFSIKYSKSDKRTLIIYFNELLFSPLKSSGFSLSIQPAKCEEALRASL